MLTSKRFYFFKAWYDWMTDNGLTAYIIVDVQYPHVQVPKDYIENDRIILNISSKAVSGFSITPQILSFEADFGSPVEEFSIIVPIRSIIAIYAQENKQGTFFVEDDQENSSDGEVNSKIEKKLPEFVVIE